MYEGSALMTLNASERTAIEKALKEKRRLLQGDPVEVLIDVAESCLYQYTTEVTHALSHIQQSVAKMQTDFGSNLSLLSNACMSLETRLSTLEHQIRTLNPGEAVAKRLTEISEAHAQRGFQQGVAAARKEFMRRRGEGSWGDLGGIVAAVVLGVVAFVGGMMVG
jgi:hypothetical protein